RVLCSQTGVSRGGRAMNWHLLYLASVCLACLALGLQAGAGGPPPGKAAADAEFARLVRQLGSPRHKERQQAHDALARLGAAALPRLRAAAVGHSDAEVRRRLALIVRAIEE